MLLVTEPPKTITIEGGTTIPQAVAITPMANMRMWQMETEQFR